MTLRKLINVVIPAFNEEACVEELAKRLAAVYDQESEYDFETIIIENGSIDATWEKLQVIARQDPRFKVVKLSRNFRMDGGLTAGLSFCKGDAAILMTADLQDPPESIPSFRAAVNLSHVPWPIRQFVWWFALNFLVPVRLVA